MQFNQFTQNTIIGEWSEPSSLGVGGWKTNFVLPPYVVCVGVSVLHVHIPEAEDFYGLKKGNGRLGKQALEIARK